LAAVIVAAVLAPAAGAGSQERPEITVTKVAQGNASDQFVLGATAERENKVSARARAINPNNGHVFKAVKKVRLTRISGHRHRWTGKVSGLHTGQCYRITFRAQNHAGSDRRSYMLCLFSPRATVSRLSR
jgi:hypothetical protein